MNSTIIFFVLLISITILGGGGGYLFWLKTRPKKQIWIAKVYQLRKGVIPRARTKEGKEIGIEMRDLVPYIRDTIEKREKDKGMVTYVLSRLNITVNSVTAENVEVWGDQKEVNVLVEGDTATVMRFGYDETTGSKVFIPMPRERIDMIKNEIMLKKDRLENKKDILAQILPWIAIGMIFLALIGIVYIVNDSSVKVATKNAESQKYHDDQMVEAANIYREAVRGISESLDETIDKKIDKKLGPQE